MTTDIFISYRREGGRDYARNVYLALGKLGYQDIFFDYNSIRNGVFNAQILDAIKGCKDFVLILSRGSMDRCVNDDDWVRREIVAAIESGCNIIPIKIGNGSFDFPDDFPPILDNIRKHQFFTLLTDEFFDDSIKHISESLNSKPKCQVFNANKSEEFVLNVSSDETCEFFIDKERFSKFKAGKMHRLTLLKPGRNYSFEFRSLSSKNCVISLTYKVPSIKSSDQLMISFLAYKDQIEQENKQKVEKQKKERESRIKQKESLRLMLREYDSCDIKAYNGLTLVCRNDFYGYLDEQGLEVIPCIYNDALHFSSGLACVYDSNKWYYIDTIGNNIGICSDSPSYAINGSIIISDNGKYGIVSTTGDVLIDFVYDEILLPQNNIFAGRKDDKYLFFNLHGQQVNPILFEDIPFEQVGIRIEGNKAYHYYYSNTQETNFLKRVVLPAFVKANNRIGKIDENARQIIPCVADNLEEIDYRGVILSKINGRCGLFDSVSGRVIVPSIYKCFEMSCNHIFAYNDIIFASKDMPTFIRQMFGLESNYPYIESGTLGLLGYNGECLVPFEYNFICISECFHYSAISIIQIDEIIDLTRFFQLMAIIEKHYMYGECGDMCEEYNAMKKKIHYRKDVYLIDCCFKNGSYSYDCTLQFRYDCHDGEEYKY